MKSRDEQIAEITKSLVQGGWSAIYSFVEDHIQDWELDNDDNNE